MIGSTILDSNPKAILVANEPCIIKLWCTTDVSPDRQGSRVYLSKSREACRQDRAMPLPFETPIDIELATSEALWARADDEGRVGFVVYPMNIRG